MEHVEDAVGALDVKLSGEEIQRLEQPYKERALKVPCMPPFRRERETTL